MVEKSDKFIDIEAVLKARNPRLYKWLPHFLINYIKRTLHQDFMNTGIAKYKHLYHLEFTDVALEYLGVNTAWTGIEHVAKSGGIIIASNHPLGGLDGMALIKAVGTIRKDIRFLVNDILTGFKNFGSLFVAVNKVGTNTKDAIKIIDSVYSSDECVLIFPAGLVSRKQKGKIEDLEWKKSFISKAIEYKKDIVPTFVDGHNSKFFYNLALWRKRLGFKANIEMFYLADEMVKQKGKTIKVYFGKPIPYETFDKSRTHIEWAQVVKKFVYQMKANTDLTFGDFLKGEPAKVASS
ncbi:MAG: 1-acyl-sn-glycerol-3-phosphate acyltransferase [Bacteroidia bacterium]|nr:1-acyl-sn-glycerol-3-phosphate acyltransferase [Bacteroidia bacterium]